MLLCSFKFQPLFTTQPFLFYSFLSLLLSHSVALNFPKVEMGMREKGNLTGLSQAR